MTPRQLDLDAYLARIGLPAPAAPSLDLLRQVVARHTATIPFENLDVVLGRPIRLDLASLQAKLVAARRGGYCFEQNTLLGAALEQLGFAVRSLMARVVWGAAAEAVTPRTHMLLRVDLPDGPFLVDAGFGHLTPTAPLRLGQDTEQKTGHETYRLRPTLGETLLQARLGQEWRDVYRFADAESHPVDHEVANWFTATRPDGLFTTNVIAARPGQQCRATLLNGVVTIRDAENRLQRFGMETEPTLAAALHVHFGIELATAELTEVHAAIRRFAARPPSGMQLD
jgi:N-hydroxyarylamine O-acetyltransferase